MLVADGGEADGGEAGWGQQAVAAGLGAARVAAGAPLPLDHACFRLRPCCCCLANGDARPADACPHGPCPPAPCSAHARWSRRLFGPPLPAWRRWSASRVRGGTFYQGFMCVCGGGGTGCWRTSWKQLLRAIASPSRLWCNRPAACVPAPAPQAATAMWTAAARPAGSCGAAWRRWRAAGGRLISPCACDGWQVGRVAPARLGERAVLDAHSLAFPRNVRSWA